MANIFDLFDEVFHSVGTPIYGDKQSFKSNGITTHYYKGRVSCLEGPAVVYDDERPDEYWIDGRQVSKEKHDEIRQKHEDERNHVIYIDGRKKVITGKKLRQIKSILE